MKAYNKSNIPKAKILRKNMTPWERKLWYLFLKDYPVRFRRQTAIDNYIVDFYCAQARLAIELDGNGHYTDEKIIADNVRTAKLAKLNIKVIRICNIDVDKKFRDVCEYIDMRVKEATPPSPLRCDTSPDKGRQDYTEILKPSAPLVRGAAEQREAEG